MPLSCRYYNEKYPEIDDVVMVNVRSIGEMGAYVHLLEYNNIEGMILLSELSRRRIRSINKLIRVGKTEPVVVIRVDKEKGKNLFSSNNPKIIIPFRLYWSKQASGLPGRCRKMYGTFRKSESRQLDFETRGGAAGLWYR